MSLLRPDVSSFSSKDSDHNDSGDLTTHSTEHQVSPTSLSGYAINAHMFIPLVVFINEGDSELQTLREDIC